MTTRHLKGPECKNNAHGLRTVCFFMVGMCIFCLLFYAIAFHAAVNKKAEIQNSSATITDTHP